MITGEISFQIQAQDNNGFRMVYKKFRQKWLVKKSKFVWRKKNHPEHKYSVTFVSKVGTIKHLHYCKCNYAIDIIGQAFHRPTNLVIRPFQFCFFFVSQGLDEISWNNVNQ